MGIYLDRQKIGGCPVVFCIDASGSYADVQIVYPGMSMARVVTDMRRLIEGPASLRRRHSYLSLVRDSDHSMASAAVPPLSPGVLARICRQRLSARRDPVPLR